MAITVHWPTKIINIPRADLQLVQSVPTEIRQLDIDTFRLILKDREDDAIGMPYLNTHNNNAPVTVGGVTLARVVEIINGYTVTFEDGQYAVNLVGANSNIGDVTNVNQVSIRSANSAGLTFSDQINQQSFAGFIWVDTINGLPGIQFPRGTPTDPVDNWTDATTIGNVLNLKSFKLRNTLTLSALQNIADHTIVGLNTVSSVVILQGGTTTNLNIENLSFAGDMGTGFTVSRNCIAGVITNYEGGMFDCVINGNIQLSPTPVETNDISFVNCVSGFPGAATFTLDYNSSNRDVQFRNWSGGMVVENFNTAGVKMSIDISQGKVTLDATCTDGEIVVRGVAELIDNSGPGCTVITTGTVTNLSAAGSITEQDKDDIANKVIPHVWAAN